MAVSMKYRVFWDVAPCSHDEFIALMMEAVRISETSVNFNMTTWRYIPEGSNLVIQKCFNVNVEIYKTIILTVLFGCETKRNEELHILYSSPDVIRQMKSRRMRWAGMWHA
jgi:hypothetical protein